MAKEEADFKCLRCGHLYVGLYDPREPEERACPQCGSNSVRPLPRRGKGEKSSETVAAE